MSFITKHLEKIVLVLALTFSIGSFVFYYRTGLITAYGDSRGHLDIARRVIDSVTPGVAQLGGYWLPLLHVLMLPTIWSDFMWSSGISGSLPNMVSYVVAVLLMYRLVLYITRDQWSAFIAASVILLSPDLLYMQAAPMTESLFIGTVVAFMYFYYRWFNEKRISDLIFAALFLILASLNRYEGWGLVIAANVLMIWYWVQMKFDKKIEGAMIAFASLSGMGVFLWLLWGAVIFHDPLEFMHNALSAVNQTDTYDSWTGIHNLKDAILTNVYAIFHTSGALLFILCVLGLAVYYVRKGKFIFRAESLILLLFMVPLLFDILTVYTGKVPVEVPELSTIEAPGNYFNIRYALYTLPMLAIFTTLMTRKRFGQVVIFSLILINSTLLVVLPEDQIGVLMDAGIRSSSNQYLESLGWFKQNFNGGLILASTGGTDAWMQRTGIHQKNFITEGAYKYWDESLADPAKYATWVVMPKNNNRDALSKNLNKEALFRDFEAVHDQGGLLILKKIQ